MTPSQLADLRTDEVLRARLAKWLTQFCFRNTELENFHHRLTDDEMKTIMKDSVNHTYLALYMLFASSHGAELIELFKEADRVPEWDDPDPHSGNGHHSEAA